MHTITRICARNRDSIEEKIGVGQEKLHRIMRFDLSHEGQTRVFRHFLIWKWGRVRRMQIFGREERLSLGWENEAGILCRAVWLSEP